MSTHDGGGAANGACQHGHSLRPARRLAVRVLGHSGVEQAQVVRAIGGGALARMSAGCLTHVCKGDLRACDRDTMSSHRTRSRARSGGKISRTLRATKPAAFSSGVGAAALQRSVAMATRTTSAQPCIEPRRTDMTCSVLGTRTRVRDAAAHVRWATDRRWLVAQSVQSSANQHTQTDAVPHTHRWKVLLLLTAPFFLCPCCLPAVDWWSSVMVRPPPSLQAPHCWMPGTRMAVCCSALHTTRHQLQARHFVHQLAVARASCCIASAPARALTSSPSSSSTPHCALARATQTPQREAHCNREVRAHMRANAPLASGLGKPKQLV